MRRGWGAVARRAEIRWAGMHRLEQKSQLPGQRWAAETLGFQADMAHTSSSPMATTP